jgi:UDP:flavonoid glycosyltransferase YjiC (YdhE family)
MSRFLIVTWDGAGNLVPTLGIARRLARAGHDVRLLGHRAIDARCGNAGWRFRPFTHTIDVDSAAAVEDGSGMLRLARDLWCSPSVAADVRDELTREPADVLVGDCMLLGALTAGQAAGVPTVSLFHGAFTLFRTGPLVDLLAPRLARLNVTSVASVHDACSLSLVATPREFEPPIPTPANARFVGPILDGPPLLPETASIGDDRASGSIVLVSLSTSDQGQVPLLRTIVGVLSRLGVRAVVTTGPAIDPAALPAVDHVRIVRFVPHGELLPHAALVVTHAGLGTVMAALAHGVPMLCIPFGRDQFFNASRVEAIGAGRMLPPETDGETLAHAIERLLADRERRTSARQFARVISACGGSSEAVAALEELAHVKCRA